jgi:acyl carrier protein
MVCPEERGMDDLVFEGVRRVASDVFNVAEDEITPELSPDSVDSWDSVKHLEFVLALESKFGIQFSPVEAADILSIQSAALLVGEKVARTS